MAARHKAHRAARWQKATAMVPMALLAGAWTASLGSATTAVADSGQHAPGVPAVPTTSFDSPASYTVPPSLDPSSFGSNPHDSATSVDPSTESANGIPSAAMLAYQRAETVLNNADPSCHVSWALIAAIGRVESDHGRYGGNILNSNGKSKPGIYGVPLDGSKGTVLIKDTDSGAYDNDPIYDRAVGAMQFVPSTWEIVGVDGDGDGVRDPQDIDDSALAAAVYLCAGDQDLSTTEGQRTAVFNYNRSQAYVDLVLSIMNAYIDGDYTTVADGLPSASYIPPIGLPGHWGTPRHQPGNSSSPRPGHGSGTTDPPSSNPPPTTTPTTTTSTTTASGDPTPTGPVPTTTSPTSPLPTVPITSDPTTIVPPPVVKVLDTVAEATHYCAAHLPGNPTQEMIKECGKKLVGKTYAEAADLLSGTLEEVLIRLGLGYLIISLP